MLERAALVDGQTSSAPSRSRRIGRRGSGDFGAGRRDRAAELVAAPVAGAADGQPEESRGFGRDRPPPASLFAVAYVGSDGAVG